MLTNIFIHYVTSLQIVFCISVIEIECEGGQRACGNWLVLARTTMSKSITRLLNKAIQVQGMGMHSHHMPEVCCSVLMNKLS